MTPAGALESRGFEYSSTALPDIFHHECYKTTYPTVPRAPGKILEEAKQARNSWQQTFKWHLFKKARILAKTECKQR